MNLVICHGYAHRLTRSGIIESIPIDKIGNAGVKLFDSHSEWKSRTIESMDLSGGDIELIESTLIRLSHVFQDGQKRLPETTVPDNEVYEEAMKVV